MNRTARNWIFLIIALCIVGLALFLALQQNLKKEISMDRAAGIVFADVLKDYGSVIVEKDLKDVQRTLSRTTFQQHTAWRVQLEGLTRTDFPKEIESWGVMFIVDVFSGDILERAYES
jgi:hypothetical protein